MVRAAPVTRRVVDVLPGERWWGGAVADGEAMPSGEGVAARPGYPFHQRRTPGRWTDPDGTSYGGPATPELSLGLGDVPWFRRA